MGSAPSEEILKELEREAYAALLRVVYSRPTLNMDVSIQNIEIIHIFKMEALGQRFLTPVFCYSFSYANLSNFDDNASTNSSDDL